jgi:hypothetical protein
LSRCQFHFQLNQAHLGQVHSGHGALAPPAGDRGNGGLGLRAATVIVSDRPGAPAVLHTAVNCGSGGPRIPDPPLVTSVTLGRSLASPRASFIWKLGGRKGFYLGLQ